MGNVFRSTGGPSFELNLLRYPYLENFLQAEEFMDLGQVRTAVSNNQFSPSMIAVQEAKGRDFITELLTISQSFIVAIKSPDVYTEKQPLETTQHPGCFFHYEAVSSPAVFHDGRIMNYLQADNGDTKLLFVSHGIHDRRRMHDIQWHHANAVDKYRPNLRSVKAGHCSILHIRRDIFL